MGEGKPYRFVDIHRTAGVANGYILQPDIDIPEGKNPAELYEDYVEVLHQGPGFYGGINNQLVLSVYNRSCFSISVGGNLAPGNYEYSFRVGSLMFSETYNPYLKNQIAVATYGLVDGSLDTRVLIPAKSPDIAVYSQVGMTSAGTSGISGVYLDWGADATYVLLNSGRHRPYVNQLHAYLGGAKYSEFWSGIPGDVYLAAPVASTLPDNFYHDHIMVASVFGSRIQMRAEHIDYSEDENNYYTTVSGFGATATITAPSSALTQSLGTACWAELEYAPGQLCTTNWAGENTESLSLQALWNSPYMYLSSSGSVISAEGQLADLFVDISGDTRVVGEVYFAYCGSDAYVSIVSINPEYSNQLAGYEQGRPGGVYKLSAASMASVDATLERPKYVVAQRCVQPLSLLDLASADSAGVVLNCGAPIAVHNHTTQGLLRGNSSDGIVIGTSVALLATKLTPAAMSVAYVPAYSVTTRSYYTEYVTSGAFFAYATTNEYSMNSFAQQHTNATQEIATIKVTPASTYGHYIYSISASAGHTQVDPQSATDTHYYSGSRGRSWQSKTYKEYGSPVNSSWSGAFEYVLQPGTAGLYINVGLADMAVVSDPFVGYASVASGAVGLATASVHNFIQPLVSNTEFVSAPLDIPVTTFESSYDATYPDDNYAYSESDTIEYEFCLDKEQPAASVSGFKVLPITAASSRYSTTVFLSPADKYTAATSVCYSKEFAIPDISDYPRPYEAVRMASAMVEDDVVSFYSSESSGSAQYIEYSCRCEELPGGFVASSEVVVNGVSAPGSSIFHSSVSNMQLWLRDQYSQFVASINNIEDVVVEDPGTHSPEADYTEYTRHTMYSRAMRGGYEYSSHFVEPPISISLYVLKC